MAIKEKKKHSTERIDWFIRGKITTCARPWLQLIFVKLIAWTRGLKGLRKGEKKENKVLLEYRWTQVNLDWEGEFSAGIFRVDDSYGDI